jgi:hypothetical protein
MFLHKRKRRKEKEKDFSLSNETLIISRGIKSKFPPGWEGVKVVMDVRIKRVIECVLGKGGGERG